jgi:nitroreductase
LSSILWDYISTHRDDIRSDVLTAVGSAIRKYIAMLDVSRMNEIASLLEAGHRAPLSLELELEVVKMIYRKFEANPPAATDTEVALAARLWEMAQDYMRPRFILREKYATVASLAVEAIVALRGSEASDAVAAVLSSPFAWFREMVTDDLARLVGRWRQKNSNAADWCEAILRDVNPILGGEAHAGNAHH